MKDVIEAGALLFFCVFMVAIYSLPFALMAGIAAHLAFDQFVLGFVLMGAVCMASVGAAVYLRLGR